MFRAIRAESQETYNSKLKQMKAMQSELQTYQSQAWNVPFCEFFSMC